MHELVVWGLFTAVLLGAMAALALLARDIGAPAHAVGAAPAAALLAGVFFSERVVLVMRGYGWDALMPLLGTALTVLGVFAAVAHRRTLLRRRGLWSLTDEELSRRAVEEWGFGRSQARVAVLAARGLSRAQVAEELTISRTTVNAHLRLVYKRLGIHSRDELSLVFAALAKTRRARPQPKITEGADEP
ncbi:MAG: helix-turn-helix transcriptional regulator [Atopobiaceae bacterium]|nr:helix-turn-helix transcriptional regulator [Atopobiaceae bacterium]